MNKPFEHDPEVIEKSARIFLNIYKEKTGLSNRDIIAKFYDVLEANQDSMDQRSRYVLMCAINIASRG